LKIGGVIDLPFKQDLNSSVDRTNRKIINCAVCGSPTTAGAEARRIICPQCLAEGKEMPQVKQMDLLLGDGS